MRNILDFLFGPLTKEYCLYFYYLSIFSYILFVVYVIGFLYTTLMSNKMSSQYITSHLLVMLHLFLGYFYNRLLHTMCVKSI